MKTKKYLSVIGASALAVVLAAGLASCSPGNTGSSGKVAATVNGTEIMEDTITDYIQSFREASSLSEDDAWGSWMAENSLDPSTVRSEVIDYYVDIELVKKAADENGITVSDDDINSAVDSMKQNYGSDEAWNTALQTAGTTEDKYRDSVRVSMLESQLQTKITEESSSSSSSSATVDDASLLQYVSMYSSYFNGAKRSSHILFNADDQATAQSVLDQINAGTLDFAAAASQYSTDTGSAANGGDVGWDSINSFVTEYTDALGGLEKDQVSGLVNSQFGIHIIKCTDVYTAPEEITSLDQVPSEFVDYVRQMMESTDSSSVYDTWFEDYKSKADVKVNDMPSGLVYDIDISKYQSDTTDEESSAATEEGAATTDGATAETGSSDTAATSDGATVEATTTGDSSSQAAA